MNLFLFAILESPLDKLPASKESGRFHPQMQDVITIVGIALLIAAVVAGVIYFFHRSRKTKLVSGAEAVLPLEDRGSFAAASRRRRRRRLTRNPTRAETGGLPPIRDGNSAA